MSRLTQLLARKLAADRQYAEARDKELAAFFAEHRVTHADLKRLGPPSAEDAEGLPLNDSSTARSDGVKWRGRMPHGRYVNPANPSQTWNGKGARPKWVANAIARGKKPGELMRPVAH
jgi:DNA-binding protein H-NS